MHSRRTKCASCHQRPRTFPASGPMTKVPRYSKGDVKTVMAALILIKEERNRKLAIRLAVTAKAVEEAKERGDYGAVASDPVVAPQRAATGMQPFVPYVSAGQASPQTIHDKTGVSPVSVTHSDDPEWLRYAFFRCEEHDWLDPHWDCQPDVRVAVVRDVPVDNATYWC